VRIGVTFFLLRKPGSIWNCGANMHTVFLVEALRAVPGVEVVAINGGDGTELADAELVADLRLEFAKLPDVADSLDVLIEAQAQVEADQADRVRKAGGKVVAYRFGNNYVIDTERIVHGKEPGSIFNGTQFDAVWTNAQHVHTCGAYWATCYRAPVTALPHIWSPRFVDAEAGRLNKGDHFGYVRGRKSKRVAIFEPNVSVVKASMIPLLVCEQAHRQAPGCIGEVLAMNARHLQSHLTFMRFVSTLDIARAGVLSLEKRWRMPRVMAEHADVVVSHQWQNALNYAYYDALHGGYPLVHNSHLLPDGIGYRYHGFNCITGGAALAAACEIHDDCLPVYRDGANEFLGSLRPDAPGVVRAHEDALQALG